LISAHLIFAHTHLHLACYGLPPHSQEALTKANVAQHSQLLYCAKAKLRGVLGLACPNTHTTQTPAKPVFYATTTTTPQHTCWMGSW
jgi:hypothetical protein